ncbi:MAG: helix-turn-helix transcriptional regulator [Myxococcota bacterium]|nr:helix-turn-helix transcriptional regulator [Myxococcota bacterium]
MSSVRHIAVAPVYVEPEEPWIAAFDAADNETLIHTFACVWEDVVQGRVGSWRESTAEDCACCVAEVLDEPRGLDPDDASLVASVLCGEPRKALACDLNIAISTATGRVLRTLSKLELADRPVPLPLVLAAQTWAGVSRLPSARAASFEDQGRRYLAMSVPRPATAHLTTLTRAQQEVARWLLEGCTRNEIADRRETSVLTVAGQVHSIFSALRVTGRYALIRRAVELGCFHELRVVHASQPRMTTDAR